MYDISLRGIALSCVLLLISSILWTNSMGLLRSHQAFAQNSINLANPLVGDPPQPHRVVNATLQHLKVIGIANSPGSCTRSTVPIQTLSRGVHNPNPNNANSGIVSMSTLQTLSKMVQDPTNPSSCTASTLAIQKLSKGPYLPNSNPNNANSGVVPAFATQTVSNQPNPNPNNPNSGVMPTFATHGTLSGRGS